MRPRRNSFIISERYPRERERECHSWMYPPNSGHSPKYTSEMLCVRLANRKT